MTKLLTAAKNFVLKEKLFNFATFRKQLHFNHVNIITAIFDEH